MALIDDDYGASDLDPRWKAAITVTDAVLGTLAPDDPALGRAAATFTGPELDELVLTAAIAHGFSKAAIAWGPPPDMPVLEVPTPSPDGPGVS